MIVLASIKDELILKIEKDAELKIQTLDGLGFTLTEMKQYGTLADMGNSKE